MDFDYASTNIHENLCEGLIVELLWFIYTHVDLFSVLTSLYDSYICADIMLIQAPIRFMLFCSSRVFFGHVYDIGSISTLLFMVYMHMMWALFLFGFNLWPIYTYVCLVSVWLCSLFYRHICVSDFCWPAFHDLSTHICFFLSAWLRFMIHTIHIYRLDSVHFYSCMRTPLLFGFALWFT